MGKVVVASLSMTVVTTMPVDYKLSEDIGLQIGAELTYGPKGMPSMSQHDWRSHSDKPYTDFSDRQIATFSFEELT